ncbi:TonB-dependent receptor [Flagellimonas flava]|uniref:Outer membrane receptor proteins, mostly Fe transport n=1 Tax=Flagellimonas flava TaxID=570519 RepID=A0A1M5PWB4_9FLAO|nr:TonB-dependent receptor [Allomuricauda flava]SHH05992.1 Outer membrane receptor proteins, mostly Fe transport [Allomuricauda flava]
MKHLKFLVIVVCFLFGQNLIGQTFDGQVLDVQQNPIEGAYIFNQDTKSYSISDSSGYFRIGETGVGDSLRIGALGHEKLNILLTSGSVEGNLPFILNESALALKEVVITPNINALNVISKIDLMAQPVGSSQEILEKVPGLVIGQHAGGGKAEQLFLRGFDIDHGTDISISVDNMPVNMVSHAHGQGYSDLHFVIPETIENIDFDKGPYTAGKGNFATAGYVDFNTKNRLDGSSVQFEYGDFGWNRSLGLFDLLSKKRESAYLAAELLQFDGPFESSQNFSRINVFGKYTAQFMPKSQFSASVSYFRSTWDASGQIPQRAVDAGLISRFGAIDDTEGGQTSRFNINTSLKQQLNDSSFIETNAYWTHYDFNLFSNFTFFLEDPENGDQIQQKESRNLFGLNTVFHKTHSQDGLGLATKLGGGFRTDLVNGNELSSTLNREAILRRIQLGDVTETNLYGFFEAKMRLNKFTLVPGLRLDYFDFGYQDLLQEFTETQNRNGSVLSPKLSLLYDNNPNLQFFLKSGVGFHSNDSRVSALRQSQEVLPKAYGLDIGTIFKPTPNGLLNAALWYLKSEQELVYVGDAGIVEPSGRSERFGLDLGFRQQIFPWLYLHSDLTYTHARSIDEPEGSNYIPLAPDFTASGGVTLGNGSKLTAGLQYRYLDNRPANEDNSIIAPGYFVMDMNANYELGKGLLASLSIQNLFNTEWNETQFATVSQLANEATPVEEIHFTPGTPFFLKAGIRYTF